MDIQEEINSELLRLGVPHPSLGTFQMDASQKPQVVKVLDYEGVTGAFDQICSLLKILPDQAGSTVVVEALRTSRESPVGRGKCEIDKEKVK